MRSIASRCAAGFALGVVVVVVAACGGSGDGDGARTSGAVAPAQVAQAKRVIAPLVGQPTRFPIATALARRPTGARIAYMDSGTPIGALFYRLAQPAARALGMQLTRIDAGLTADTVNTAFDTVVNGDYDGVFVPAIEPTLWQRGLDELTAKGVPVVTTGVTGGDKQKIKVMQVSDGATERAGRLLAAWVVAHGGEQTHAVFYVTPEIPFIKVIGDAFEQEVARLCPACEARIAKIPAAALGTRAPSLIVDDLQAHPGTTTAVFGTAEQSQGLPSALRTAGIDIDTVANFPDPASLEQIKTGQTTVGLGVDLPVIAWTLMDSLARLVTRQPVDRGAAADIPPMQFLRAQDLPADVSRGWTGYPDFAQRFMKLWGASAK